MTEQDSDEEVTAINTNQRPEVDPDDVEEHDEADPDPDTDDDWLTFIYHLQFVFFYNNYFFLQFWLNLT